MPPSPCTVQTTAPISPDGWCARAGDAPLDDAAVDEAYTGVEASLALFRGGLRARLLRRRRRTSGGDRPLRTQLRQRVLGRPAAGLRRRRRPGVHAVHQADRRPGARVHPRRHRADRRTGLPGPVRRAQRVDVGRVRLLPQAAAARSERRGGRLVDRRGDLHPVRAGPGAALDVRAGHGLRRPGCSAGTRRSARWPTTSRPPRTTAASISTPASPTAPTTWRRSPWAATPGTASAGSGTPRSPRASARTPTSWRSPQRPSRPRRRSHPRPGPRSPTPGRRSA